MLDLNEKEKDFLYGILRIKLIQIKKLIERMDPKKEKELSAWKEKKLMKISALTKILKELQK